MNEKLVIPAGGRIVLGELVYITMIKDKMLQ